MTPAPALPLPVVAAAAAVVFAWCLLLERGRPARGRGRRLLGMAAMVAGVAGVILRPAIWPAPARGAAVVLTDPGVAAPRGVRPVFELWQGGATRGARAIPDLAWLLREQPGLGRLVIAGHGLEAEDLARFSGRLERLQTPPALPPGVADATWRRRLRLGERLEVTGVAVAGAERRTDLIAALIGPAGPEASEPLGASGRFRLAATPRATGRVSYRLEVRREGGNQAVADEPVDVWVEAAPPPVVRWEEASPGFDARFVRDWLRGLGGSLEVHRRLAPGLERVERVGSIASGSEAADGSLDAVDLLLVDGRTVDGWSAERRAAIGRSVADGLGLVVRMEEDRRSLPDLALLADLAVEGDESDEPVSLVLDLAERGGGRSAEELVAAPRELAPGPGWRPLVEDRAGRTVAAARRWGRGRVALTLVRGTHRWMLRGDEASHRAYWSRIASIARALGREERLWIPDGPVIVDRPLAVALDSARAEPRLAWRDAAGGRGEAALRADPESPGRWRATLWPRAAGWMRVESGADAVEVRVAERGTWGVRSTALRRRATATRIGADAGREAETPPLAAPFVRRPLQAWAGWLAVLAGAAAAWTARSRR